MNISNNKHTKSDLSKYKLSNQGLFGIKQNLSNLLSLDHKEIYIIYESKKNKSMTVRLIAEPIINSIIYRNDNNIKNISMGIQRSRTFPINNKLNREIYKKELIISPNNYKYTYYFQENENKKINKKIKINKCINGCIIT